MTRSYELAIFGANGLIDNFLKCGTWKRDDIIELFKSMLPDFRHLETGKSLDAKM